MTFAYNVIILFAMILNLLFNRLKRNFCRYVSCVELFLCLIRMQSVYTFTNDLPYSKSCVSRDFACMQVWSNKKWFSKEKNSYGRMDPFLESVLGRIQKIREGRGGGPGNVFFRLLFKSSMYFTGWGWGGGGVRTTRSNWTQWFQSLLEGVHTGISKETYSHM